MTVEQKRILAAILGYMAGVHDQMREQLPHDEHHSIQQGVIRFEEAYFWFQNALDDEQTVGAR